MAIPSFVDRVTLHVRAGDGGHGVASVHREKFKPLGGPDGGNGGRGGDIVLRVASDVTTLIDYHHVPHRKAGKGMPGAGGKRNGANGDDLILSVPSGTVVKDLDGNELADLVGVGTEVVIAAGGRGGLGNAALASSKRKAPGFALKGEPGEELSMTLELKVVADIGLIGFPSAGKSSLIAALSRAKPKIADYPFTTLVPNLGVVTAGDVTFTVADVPGLIEGASEGKGLGHDFLRHVERCAALVHVIDCATVEPGRDPITDLATIESELERYGQMTGTDLSDRPRLVALNKTDVPDAAQIAEFVRGELEDMGYEVFDVSAASHVGLRTLSFAMARIVLSRRDATPEAEPTRIVLRPSAGVGVDKEFEIIQRDDQWVVRGEKPRRWVNQTDFGNDEAVGFLADRLNRLGVEDELITLGAQPGDAVLIGDDDNSVVFDFDPSIEAGAEILGRRGEDLRFDQSERRTSKERREQLAAKRAWEAENQALIAQGVRFEDIVPFGENDQDEDEDSVEVVDVWDADEEYDGEPIADEESESR